MVDIHASHQWAKSSLIEIIYCTSYIEYYIIPKGGSNSMRKTSLIRPWLSEKQLQAWVREARSREDYQKRLAIWLTVTGPFPAHRVASLLVVSKQAVWLWISQYNRLGPDGLQRQGRGGRRRAYLSPTQ